ncbi:MAG: hypothetical protein LBI29_04285 [Rickettsiales bacterium]|jgi:hypothetical protein|nr:hypothetical protein [Rickettsiales bacterium]
MLERFSELNNQIGRENGGKDSGGGYCIILYKGSHNMRNGVALMQPSPVLHSNGVPSEDRSLFLLRFRRNLGEELDMNNIKIPKLLDLKKFIGIIE